MRIIDLPIINHEDLIDNYSLKLPNLLVKNYSGNYAGLSIDGEIYEKYSHYTGRKTGWKPRIFELKNTNFVGGVWCIYSRENGFRVNYEPLDYSHRSYANLYTDCLNQFANKENKRLRGNTLLLSAQWSTDYYHFVWETLQKLFYAEKVIGLKFFDQIVIGEVERPYIREWFRVLNYETSKIKYIKHNQDYTCDSLYVITQITNTGTISRQFCNFLTDKAYSSCQPNTPVKEIVYIPRKNRRILVNEQNLINALNKKNYFELANFENLPLWTQLNISRNAKVLIAPHGASLANKIISQAKTIEIISENSNNTCYLNHSAQGQLEHYYIKATTLNQDMHLSEKKINAIVNKLENIL